MSEPDPFAGPDHPIRKVTRKIAFEGGWSPERAQKVAGLFDSMAADWSAEHVDETKAAPIVDAVARGGVDLSGDGWRSVREPGPGPGCCTTGCERCWLWTCLAEMLANAPDLAPRARADCSTLPVPDDAVDTVLWSTCSCFPEEVDRVLAPGVNSSGSTPLVDQTPIHLPPDDVATALPGQWTGQTARAGTGLWACSGERHELGRSRSA